jgi:hypothetical protein
MLHDKTESVIESQRCTRGSERPLCLLLCVSRRHCFRKEPLPLMYLHCSKGALIPGLAILDQDSRLASCIDIDTNTDTDTR